MKNQAILKIILILLVLSLCTWIFFEIADNFNKAEIQNFDLPIISFVQGFISDHMTSVMLAITFLGSVQGAASITLIFVLILWIKKYRTLSIYLAVSVALGAGVFNRILKYIFKRQRPDIMRVIQETGYSFPSGHSMGSMILFGCLVFILFRVAKKQWSKFAGTLFAMFIVLNIGISRIYLGVHYPSDVVGGYAAGLIWVILSAMALMLFERKFKL
ncbi:phosphatase PAP2 family protein [Weizmannia acidilactici]|uniref:phosphatase PAP2 family protein n=1 Tax=Weizmannia acidilactici TaxID=2607726 RepID=UPI00124E4DC0|nr:phosphatase PAP2 family protein [Weizmannia acidilactici]GER74538.1 phosphatidylglycerophosphatase B [Weizmannia acidilactici]